MAVPIYQVDAFTSEPFRGNPAAVCLLDEEQPRAWLQNVASEMNLSETAFVVPRDGAFDLRWFTPTVEVPLCGHATLSSAHVLWETKSLLSDEDARFKTLSGELRAHRSGSAIELDFPAIEHEAAEMTAELRTALGIGARYVGLARVDEGDPTYLLELESEEQVRQLQPDFALLRRDVQACVIVTARSRSNGFDFVSRFFAPNFGIDEDPVTGLAHCIMTPYWSQLLGKTEMKAYQASHRGGEVGIRFTGDRVTLIGQAVTVLRGVMTAEPMSSEP